jgi:UDP-N-acetylglucosamine transferase subunit ALG13
MIFLTVGTQFPFDRLVRAVDEAVGRNPIDEDVFAQVGSCSYQPLNFQTVAQLDKNQFDNQLRKASGIISHAGIGSIITALENNKPMLVLPRLKQYGEVVNDHQLYIARKFEEDGYLLAAYEVGELPVKIEKLKSFVPEKRRTQTEAVAKRISIFLYELSGSKK